MAAWEQFKDKHSKSNFFISAKQHQGPTNHETTQTKATAPSRGHQRASWNINHHMGPRNATLSIGTPPPPVNRRQAPALQVGDQGVEDVKRAEALDYSPSKWQGK